MEKNQFGNLVMEEITQLRTIFLDSFFAPLLLCDFA